jgi:hypothetical protein
MTHDECSETLALHALGSTLAGDAAALESHLERCPACATELAILQETVASLGLVALPITPSRGHLDRVLRALDAEDTTRRRATNRSMIVAIRPPAVRERRRWRPLALAVRLAVAAVVVLLATSQIVLVHRLGRVSRELDYMRGAASFVTSPTVSVVTLWGPRGTPRAHAKVAYDRTSGRFILLSSRLVPPPEGMRYQLWVIADGVQAATARLPGSSDGVLRTPPRGDELFFFALSIEPLDAVDEPTGPMVLMSRPLRDDP